MNTNDQLILVSGYSATGKSASLMNIKNPENWLYLNCEGKKLPFRSKFQEFQITDPYQVYEAFEYGAKDEVEGIIVDSLTYLMDLFEVLYINTASDTRKAWQEFGNFFRTLMLDKVVKFGKNTVFLAHTLDMYDENSLTVKTYVPIKGSLKNQGVESYFSVVLSTKKVALKDLKDYQNELLHITPDDELVGFKYVFQTRLTKDSLGERIRGPLGLWSQKETFIDNDCQQVLDRLKKFYA